MKSCPSCGAPGEPAARFCLECGYAFEELAVGDTDPWLGRMVAGRFRLLAKLGDGGMGEVYLAEQLPMGRRVAVKVLRQALSDDPKQVERFKREAQAASQLTHPNTITVHDFGQDTDGTLFLAMEYLEGRPLCDVISADAPLPAERAVRIMQQVCGSLEEAHARGMVHRDLKPENIFLIERAGQPDYVKVLDFGIAKVTESGGEKLATITQAGAIFGTPQYMAPEQIRGEAIDARADLYALGVVLYEMLAGHLPFQAGSVVEMLTKHLTAPPAPIARGATPPDPAVARLEGIALRALSKDPDGRQSSVRAFLEDLMAALPHLSVTAATGLLPATPTGTPGWAEPVAAPSVGGSAKVVVLTALIAAVAVGGWFWFQGGGGGAVPAVLLQDAPEDQAGGDAPASDAPASDAPEQAAPSDAPEQAAPSDAPEQAAPASDAAPDSEAEPTAEQKAEAEAIEKKIEEEAQKAEAEAAAAEANTQLSDEEAARIAAQAEAEANQAAAEAKQAAAEAEKAKAEQKAKSAEEKAKKAEAKKAEALAKKSEAEAEKQAAKEAAAEAKAKQAEAEAKANEAKAAAAAAAAQSEAEKKAAADAQAKAAADLAAAKQAQDAAKAAAEAAKAEAAKIKAEAEALKAQLAKIEQEKADAAAKEAAAKAAAEEAAAKQAEAKAKAKAARAKKRAVGPAKLYVSTRSLNVTITVDGRRKGKSPLRGALRLSPGKHTITATKGGKRVSRTVTIKPGKVTRLRLNI